MQQLAIPGQEQFANRSWMPLRFSDRLVEREKLRCLLENTNRTPSFMNEQPWSFIIATKDDPIEFDRLFSCLSEASADLVRKAPVLMLSVARLTYSFDGERNTHAFRDARHAISHLLQKAKVMGFTAEQMAGFNPAKARQQFQIPSGFEPVAAIAIGYPAEPEGLSLPVLEEATREKRSLESFVFTGSWGHASRLLDQAALNDKDCAGNALRFFQPEVVSA
jgi:nitroreductase